MVCRTLMLLIAATLLTASCATEPEPVRSGELRLLTMQVPRGLKTGTVQHVTMAYDAVVMPDIVRVCFRWLSKEASEMENRAGCYEFFDYNGQSDIDRQCSPWVRAEDFKKYSSLHCVEPPDIMYAENATLSVDIPVPDKGDYRLVGYVDYRWGGRFLTSNSLSEKVFVGY